MNAQSSAYRRASDNLIHPAGEAVASDNDASKCGRHEHGKEQKTAQLLSSGERPLFHVPPPFGVLRVPNGTRDMDCFYRTLQIVSTWNARWQFSPNRSRLAESFSTSIMSLLSMFFRVRAPADGRT